MQTYTGYIRKEFDLTPDLYYDFFMNLCEPEMRKKLDGNKGDQRDGGSKNLGHNRGYLGGDQPHVHQALEGH